MNALKHEERGLNAVCEVMEKYEQKAVEEGLSLFEKAITMLASGKSPSEVVLTGVPQNIVDRASRAMKPKLNKYKVGSNERIISNRGGPFSMQTF